MIVIFMKRNGSKKMISFIKKIDKDYAFSKGSADDSVIRGSIQELRNKEESIFKEEFNVEEN